MGWIAFVKWLSPLAVKVAHGNEFWYKHGVKLSNNSSLHSHCRTIFYKMVNHQQRISFEQIKWRTVVDQSESKSESCPGSVVIALAVRCRDFCFLTLSLILYVNMNSFCRHGSMKQKRDRKADTFLSEAGCPADQAIAESSQRTTVCLKHVFLRDAGMAVAWTNREEIHDDVCVT